MYSTEHYVNTVATVNWLHCCLPHEKQVRKTHCTKLHTPFRVSYSSRYNS